jgi:lipopolysaccharide/colanic/teichoic acid biosynthesis glycosyltransferase
MSKLAKENPEASHEAASKEKRDCEQKSDIPADSNTIPLLGERRGRYNSVLRGSIDQRWHRLGRRTQASMGPSSRCECDEAILTEMASSAEPGRQIPYWKRALDVTCILVSLPCWLPAAIGILLWIRIVSPGAIFYRQERIGYRGRRFVMFKFRTMKLGVETTCHEHHLKRLIEMNCPMTKLDIVGDLRLIRGGRFLRAVGLDELPQILNVLRGDMSLVGPRPCTAHEFRHYDTWQQQRVNVAPGLTGYWQVNGKNKTTFTEMINLDIFYAQNMSLRLDVRIMLKTFPALAAQLLESRNGNGARKRAINEVAGQL